MNGVLWHIVIFNRVVLAIGFLPSGFSKISGDNTNI